jgi:Txe/YoeB family toxin of Txe-Axe toxin-antitoxin module
VAKPVGQLKGFYSIRLAFQDKIVYSIDEENQYAEEIRCNLLYYYYFRFVFIDGMR